MKKSCFFIGHSDAPDSLGTKLDDAIEMHITVFGVNSFVVGNYGHFDRMAQSALARAKKRNRKCSGPRHPP